MLLNLDDAPKDPAERLLWLSGVHEAVTSELDQAWAETYASLRQDGRFEWALRQGFHSRYRALKFTRQFNESRGRMIRWNDGLDRTSSAYGER